MFDVNGSLRRTLRKLPHAALDAGLPPAALGYRWVGKRVLDREAAVSAGGDYEVLQPARCERNPLPLNIESPDDLPDDAGWWGYSFRDVPTRESGETAVVRLPDATLAFHTDPVTGNFHVGVLDANDTALALREIDVRPHHGLMLRREQPRTVDRLTWICERVYHNHSHWLTAHVPKLHLLAELDRLDELVLPTRRSPVIDATLARFGLSGETVRSVDVDRPLRVGELTLLVTDRFRPELLRAGAGRVRTAPPAGSTPTRRIYVSRDRAPSRHLLDEDDVWTIFRDAGFERVRFEEMSFSEQLDLAAETEMLAGPHGAGLTNQLLCPPGATVIEIADLGFPNPNFYATAAAMGHRYAVLDAESVGDGHRLFRDLRVDPEAVHRLLTEVAT